MKNSDKISQIFSVFVMSLFFIGGIMFVTYATDTYATIGNLKSSALDMVVRNGRPVMALFYWLCASIGIGNTTFLMLSNVVAFVMISAAVYVFLTVLNNYIKDGFLALLLSSVTIINLYIIEYFMFMEKGCMMFGIFMAIMAMYFEHKHLVLHNNKVFDINIGISFLFLLCATMTYQTASNMYIVLLIPFIYRYSESVISMIFNWIRIFILFGITYVIDVLLLKITGSARVGIGINVMYPIKGLVETTVKTFDIIPAGIYLIVLLLGLGLNIWHLCKFSNNKKKEAFGLFVMLVVSNLFPIFTIFMTNGWYTPRIVYPLGCCAGILFINFFVNSYSDVESKEFIVKLTKVFVIVLMVFQFFGFTRIYIDKYVMNRLDEYRIKQIADAISEYEKSSGQEVTQIAVYIDADLEYYTYFDDMYDGGDLVVSSFDVEWSDVKAISYYTGVDYEKVDPSGDMTMYFADRNWDSFSIEQLVFDNNTLHMCLY